MVRRGIRHPCRGALISDARPGVLPPAIILQPSGLGSVLPFSGLNSVLPFSGLNSVLPFSGLNSVLSFSGLGSVLPFSGLNSVLSFSPHSRQSSNTMGLQEWVTNSIAGHVFLTISKQSDDPVIWPASETLPTNFSHTLFFSRWGNSMYQFSV